MSLRLIGSMEMKKEQPQAQGCSQTLPNKDLLAIVSDNLTTTAV